MKTELITKLEALMNDVMEAGNAVGMAAALIDRNGSVLWQRLCGLRDRDRNLPLDEDTIFGLASVSKSFTSIAMLQLEEQGILSINDPVSNYIPEYRGFHHGEPVRIRHLMSHTGGYSPVFRHCIGPVIQQLGIDASKEDVGLSEAIASAGCRQVAEALDTQALIGHPGQYFSYCNDGFGLLSEIIRRKGDCSSFAEYMVKHICAPLGMTRSSAEFLAPAADVNHSMLYEKRNGIMTGDSDYTNNAFVLGGGGAMKSSLHDMKQYVKMLLRHGEGVMSRASAEKMCLPSAEYSPVSWYGFGLYSRRIGDHLAWGHGGSLPGVSSHILFDADADVGAVVLCNTSGVSVAAVAEGALQTWYGMEPSPLHGSFAPARWDEAALADRLGAYHTDEDDDFTLVKNESGVLSILQEGKSRIAECIGLDTLQLKGRFGDTYACFLVDE